MNKSRLNYINIITDIQNSNYEDCHDWYDLCHIAERCLNHSSLINNEQIQSNYYNILIATLAIIYDTDILSKLASNLPKNDLDFIYPLVFHNNIGDQEIDKFMYIPSDLSIINDLHPKKIYNDIVGRFQIYNKGFTPLPTNNDELTNIISNSNIHVDDNSSLNYIYNLLRSHKNVYSENPVLIDIFTTRIDFIKKIAIDISNHILNCDANHYYTRPLYEYLDEIFNIVKINSVMGNI
jgi:hypothetical protein